MNGEGAIFTTFLFQIYDDFSRKWKRFAKYIRESVSGLQDSFFFLRLCYQIRKFRVGREHEFVTYSEFFFFLLYFILTLVHEEWIEFYDAAARDYHFNRGLQVFQTANASIHIHDVDRILYHHS